MAIEGIIMAVARVTKPTVSWMVRVMTGKRALFWVRTFIVALFLHAVASDFVSIMIALRLFSSIQEISDTMISLVKKRDEQIASLMSTDQKLSDLAITTTRLLDRAVARLDAHDTRLAHDEGQVETLMRRYYPAQQSQPSGGTSLPAPQQREPWPPVGGSREIR